jgi:hypothetical protein
VGGEGHVIHAGERRNAYKSVAGKTEVSRTVGKSMR